MAAPDNDWVAVREGEARCIHSRRVASVVGLVAHPQHYGQARLQHEQPSDEQLLIARGVPS